MVRRTKQDALATRHGLLDAAERLFQRQGVSHTSLQQIAQAAGTTRGAIYWHFKDKADLFNAMMERVTLPMEDALDRAAQGDDGDPLQRLRGAVLHALHKTATDAQTQRVFEVATHKVEYVDELSAVRERHCRVRRDCLAQMQRSLSLAAGRRGVRLPVPAAVAAQGLHALIDGLIQNWLLEPAAFDLQRTGRRALDTYLQGLGLGQTAAAAPAAAAEAALV